MRSSLANKWEKEQRQQLLNDWREALHQNAEAREALSELVRLKDGPRDEEYERQKELAWERARRVLEEGGTWRTSRYGPQDREEGEDDSTDSPEEG